MAAFNLTAELNLRGPSNLNQIVSNIRRQLSTISFDLNINPNTSRGIQTVSANVRTLSAALRDAQTNASALSTTLSNLASTINNTGNAANNVGNAFTRLNNQARNTGNAIREGATGMEDFGRQSALAIRRFAAFSVATGAVYSFVRAISSAYSEFVNFNKEFVRLQQVTNSTASGLSGLAQEITRLSTGLGVSSSELLNVSTTLAQAGLSATQTKTALEALAKSALAPSFDNLNDTVEGSIALLRQFGLGAGDLESALGSINAVAAKFAVEASDIITAIQRTGGVFASASKGVSEGKDALNEFIAVFTSVRATTRESAETIATGLRTIFTRVQRGGTIQALKEYGITLTDLEGKFVGPFEAVKRLSEGLKNLDPRDLRFNEIVEELGGFRQIGKVIPLIQQFATAQQALGVAQRGAGSLADDAAKAQEALAIRVTKVREEFITLIRDIGQTQSFQKFVDISLQLASALISVASAAKDVLPAITAIAAIRAIPAIGQFASGFGRNITRRNEGGPISRFANGGMVPGSGNRDTVPAMLTPGEFVIRKKAVEAIGVDKLHKMNKYATGGVVKKFGRGGMASDDPILSDIINRLRAIGGPAKAKQIASQAGVSFSGIPSMAFKASTLQAGKVSRENLVKLGDLLGSVEKFSQSASVAQIMDAQMPTTQEIQGLSLRGPNPKQETVSKKISGQKVKITRKVAPKDLADRFENIVRVRAEAMIFELSGLFDAEMKAAGIQSSISKSQRDKMLKTAMATNTGNLIGDIFERTLIASGATIGRTGKGERRPIDLESLGPVAELFGLDPNKPTEIKRSMARLSLGRKGLSGQISRYLKMQKGFAQGGSAEDTVPALLTPGEFVINKKAASKLGSATLNRLNKADKIKGFNKGGSVGDIQSFAGGGTVQSFFAGGLVQAITQLTRYLPQLATSVAQAVGVLPRNIPQGAGWLSGNAGTRAMGLPQSRGGMARNALTDPMTLLFGAGIVGQGISSGVGGGTGEGLGAGFTAATMVAGIAASLGALTNPLGILATTVIAGSSAISAYTKAVRDNAIEANNKKIEASSEALNQSLDKLAKSGNIAAGSLDSIKNNLSNLVGAQQSNLDLRNQEAQPGFFSNILEPGARMFGFSSVGRIDDKALGAARFSDSKTASETITRTITELMNKGMNVEQAIKTTGQSRDVVRRSIAISQRGSDITNIEAQLAQAREDMSNAFDPDTFAPRVKDLERKLAETINIANEEYTKQQQALTNVQRTANLVTAQLNLFADAVKNVEAAASRASSEFQEAQRNIDINLGSAFGESSKISSPSRMNENILQNLRAYSTTEITSAINKLGTNLRLSPEFTKRASGAALSQKVLETELPKILSSLTGLEREGVFGAGREAQITEQLKKALMSGGVAEPEARSVVEDILKNLSGKTTGEISLDDLLSNSQALAKLYQNNSKIIESLNSVTQNFNATMETVVSRLNQYVGALESAISAQIDAQNIRGQGSLQLQQALGQNVGLSALNNPFNQTISNMTRTIGAGNTPIAGTGTTDPNEIARRLAAAEQRKREIEARATGANAQQFAGQLTQVTLQIRQYENALKKLASDTGRASNALSEISRLRQRRETRQNSFLDFASNITKPDFLMETIQQAASFGKVMSGQGTTFDIEGAIAGFNKRASAGFVDADTLEKEKTQLIEGIIKILEATGAQIPQEMRQILTAQFGQMPEEKNAIDEFNKAIEAQAAATEQLGKITQNSAQSFYDKVLAAADAFLARISGASNVPQANPVPVAKASGGVVYANKGQYVNFKPKGTDTVPAMLTPGEFVVNAQSTKKHLGLLKSINKSKGGVVYLADGGLAEERKRRREEYLEEQKRKREEFEASRPYLSKEAKEARKAKNQETARANRTRLYGAENARLLETLPQAEARALQKRLSEEIRKKNEERRLAEQQRPQQNPKESSKPLVLSEPVDPAFIKDPLEKELEIGRQKDRARAAAFAAERAAEEKRLKDESDKRINEAKLAAENDAQRRKVAKDEQMRRITADIVARDKRKERERLGLPEIATDEEVSVAAANKRAEEIKRESEERRLADQQRRSRGTTKKPTEKPVSLPMMSYDYYGVAGAQFENQQLQAGITESQALRNKLRTQGVLNKDELARLSKMEGTTTRFLNTEEGIDGFTSATEIAGGKALSLAGKAASRALARTGVTRGKKLLRPPTPTKLTRSKLPTAQADEVFGPGGELRGAFDYIQTGDKVLRVPRTGVPKTVGTKRGPISDISKPQTPSQQARLAELQKQSDEALLKSRRSAQAADTTRNTDNTRARARAAVQRGQESEARFRQAGIEPPNFGDASLRSSQLSNASPSSVRVRSSRTNTGSTPNKSALFKKLRDGTITEDEYNFLKSRYPKEMVGYAKGGIVYANKGTLIPYRPIGSDTVPAMLTPGEFVVNKQATQRNLPLLKAINNDNSQYLSKGGKVNYLRRGGEPSVSSTGSGGVSSFVLDSSDFTSSMSIFSQTAGSLKSSLDSFAGGATALSSSLSNIGTAAATLSAAATLIQGATNGLNGPISQFTQSVGVLSTTLSNIPTDINFSVNGSIPVNITVEVNGGAGLDDKLQPFADQIYASISEGISRATNGNLKIDISSTKNISGLS